jgi:hypothetical protein
LIIIDPEKRYRTHTERDLAIEMRESATSQKIMSEMKAPLSPILERARRRQSYEIDSSEEAKIRKLD